MQIVLATRNQHKKQELVALLGGMDITIRTLDDFPDAPDVVEDGETCEANAMKKAVEAGREAFLAGRMPRKLYSAIPSSPTTGMIGS